MIRGGGAAPNIEKNRATKTRGPTRSTRSAVVGSGRRVRALGCAAVSRAPPIGRPRSSGLVGTVWPLSALRADDASCVLAPRTDMRADGNVQQGQTALLGDIQGCGEQAKKPPFWHAYRDQIAGGTPWLVGFVLSFVLCLAFFCYSVSAVAPQWFQNQVQVTYAYPAELPCPDVYIYVPALHMGPDMKGNRGSPPPGVPDPEFGPGSQLVIFSQTESMGSAGSHIKGKTSDWCTGFRRISLSLLNTFDDAPCPVATVDSSVKLFAPKYGINMTDRGFEALASKFPTSTMGT